MSQARPAGEQRVFVEICHQERRLRDLHLRMSDGSTESAGFPEGNAGTARGRSSRQRHGREEADGGCVEKTSDGGREENLDGKLERSNVRRWEGAVVGVRKVEKECSRSLPRSVCFSFLSLYFSRSPLSVVGLYDVHLSFGSVYPLDLPPISLVISTIDHTTLTCYSPPTLQAFICAFAPPYQLTLFFLCICFLSRVWHGPCATYAIYAFALASEPKKFVCPLLVCPINYTSHSRTEATTVAPRVAAPKQALPSSPYGAV